MSATVMGGRAATVWLMADEEKGRGTREASVVAGRTAAPGRWGLRVAAAGLAALLITGCSAGSGAPSTSLRLLVSEDFGAVTVDELDAPKSSPEDTVLQLLERNEEVTAPGGRVQSIAGRAAGQDGGRPFEWSVYVNGVVPEEGAASVKVRASDRIWWDRHEETTAQSVAAVVGSFPEPFLHGYDGERLPTRLECTEARSRGCEVAGKRFGEIGVVAGRGRLQGSTAQATNRVIVGRWNQIRDDETAQNLENGAQASGVYARPTRDGKSIDILDAQGKVARTLGAGSGLIAATRFEGGRPVWIITGTDDAGLAAAADALQEGDLGGHFALAISGGQAVDVPMVARRAPDARGAQGGPVRDPDAPGDASPPASPRGGDGG